MKNSQRLLPMLACAAASMMLGLAENSASAQTIVITGTNLTHAISMMPQYIPPIENTSEWPVYANSSFAVASNAMVPDRTYMSWSNVVIAATFDPTKCTIGPGAPSSQGRLGFATVVTPAVPGSGSQISASMLYAVFKSNDGQNNVFGGTFAPTSYAPECRGRIFGQNGNADQWITSGSATNMVDAVYWTPGPANGFVANNSGDYENITNYIHQYQPFVATCTIYVVDGNGSLRAGGGANGQGIAAVSTAVSPAIAVISQGSSPGTVFVSPFGGSSNIVYSVYGTTNVNDPLSVATYMGTTSGGMLQIGTGAGAAGFFRLLSN